MSDRVHPKPDAAIAKRLADHVMQVLGPLVGLPAGQSGAAVEDLGGLGWSPDYAAALAPLAPQSAAALDNWPADRQGSGGGLDTDLRVVMSAARPPLLALDSAGHWGGA